MVATQSSADGMKLYVDGALVGTNAADHAQDYTGYWRVGGDTDWGGDSPFFDGTIDEVAIYSRALTASSGACALHGRWRHSCRTCTRSAAFSSTRAAGLTASLDGTGSTDPDGTDRQLRLGLR